MKRVHFIILILSVALVWPVWAKEAKEAEESGAAARHGLSEEVMTSKLIVNIPAKQVELYDQGELVYAFPVAVGTSQYKTPTGARALRQIVWNPWWLPPPDSEWAKDAKPTPPGPGNPLGIVKMDLGGAILMHGTNKEYTVGTAASHGCMRMRREDVKTLAWWIQSHYTNKNDPALLDNYAAHASTSFYVNLKTPIPVEIRYDLVAMGKKMLKAHPDVYGRAKDLKKRIYELLNESGYSEERVREAAIEKLLSRSKTSTIEMPLRELITGKLKPSKERPSDPVEISWKNKKPRKFSSLLGSRFL